MLLTSSQVSVLVSSGIGKPNTKHFPNLDPNLTCKMNRQTNTHSLTVVVFTAALFLSGYVIQQRTLHQLRIAIRPAPRASKPNVPAPVLPDRFKKSTTQLADGTVVVVDGEGNIVSGGVNGVSGSGVDNGDGGLDAAAAFLSRPQRTREELLLEIKQTLPEEVEARERAAAAAEGGKLQPQTVLAGTTRSDEKRKSRKEKKQRQKQNKKKPLAEPSPVSEGEGKAAADGQHAKKVSAAERRRLIKEEIQRLSQGEGPVYYQRRLW